MRSRFRRALVPAMVLAFVAGLSDPSIGWAVDRSFALNLKRVPIAKLIERVAGETRRTILFDEQIRGNISIVTKRPVTEDESWSILQSSLSMLGFSILPSTVGNWRISKNADAVGEAPFVDELESPTGAFVTALIPLASADLQSVLNVLTPLAGSRVTLVPYSATHSLIASGPEREIARLTTIADELGRVDEFELEARVLRYRDVEEVEPIIEARIESGRISERQLQVWSDQRTNSILYRGTDDETARLARFIDRLDRPLEGKGQIQILRVLNRDPEEIGELIRSLAQAGASTSGAESGLSRLAGAHFVIAVDRASRSLVVRADAATQIEIRKVLEILDEPPQLIAVDITVSELRTPRTFALGFGFVLPLSTGNDPNDVSGVIANIPPGGLLAGRTDQTTIFGRVSHDNGVPFTVDGGDGIEIDVEQSGVLSGADFNVRSEVLLKPSLILTAGEQHEIFVGNNFPVPVTADSGVADLGSGGVSASALTRTTTFERTDIGIRLGIEARAGRKGKIQLDLDVDISSLAPSVAGPIEEVGPTFVNQTLAATARMDDGETAIIAIDRQIREVRGRSGVPWLSEIPFLGWLFSTDLENDQDVRLVIAARARRISSPSELVADSIRRRLAFQRRNARGAAIPTADGPPFGVRVTTRQREDDARAIAEGLMLRGHQTVIHQWTLSNEEFFDVYVVSLESMVDAAEIADALSADGWDADLVVLPTRS